MVIQINLINLTEKTKAVQHDNRMTTSHEGRDLGRFVIIYFFNYLMIDVFHRSISTYVSLHCTGCKTVLGRIYKMTASQLDCIRDLFTFDVEKVER
jgi:hypothetical protein